MSYLALSEDFLDHVDRATWKVVIKDCACVYVVVNGSRGFSIAAVLPAAHVRCIASET